LLGHIPSIEHAQSYLCTGIFQHLWCPWRRPFGKVVHTCGKKRNFNSLELEEDLKTWECLGSWWEELSLIHIVYVRASLRFSSHYGWRFNILSYQWNSGKPDSSNMTMENNLLIVFLWFAIEFCCFMANGRMSLLALNANR
jgi:hypothetical protein